jgi:non-specific serine/threonine protein kinase
MDKSAPTRFSRPAQDAHATVGGLANVSRPPGARPSSVPTPLTSLVGREHECATARALLIDQAGPLLTLTGPGGVGKTRLALAVAHDVAGDFADGAVFVDLTPVRDSTLVLPAIARVLGVREAGDRELADVLSGFLKPRQILLVLDNCEQVLAAAADVAALLAACPALQVLATSRAPLRVRGEQVVTVEPLSTPEPGASHDTAHIASTAAVALLLERAKSVDAQLTITDENAEAFAEICRRLDGLPLAIELAAPRLRVLSPLALLALLDERLRLLSGGYRDAPARHQTLQSAIAWSYELLSPDEQSVFRGLAVFVGGFDLPSVAATLQRDSVTTSLLLEGLVERSLLQRTDGLGGEPRFRMLETVREFASKRLLAEGEERSRREAHARHFLELPESLRSVVYGPEGSRVLAQYEIEYPNTRAALGFFAEQGDAESELRLAAVLSEFWRYRGNHAEGIALTTAAVERGASASPAVFGKALMELSYLCHYAGEPDRALEYGLASLAPSREGGSPFWIAHALYICALTLGHDHGRWDEAIAMLEEAEHMVPAGQPFPTATLGEMYVEIGEIERGADYLECALNLDLANGRLLDAGKELTTLGRVEEARGNQREAARRYADALRHLKIAGAPSHAILALAYVCVLASTRSLPVATARLLGMIAGLHQRLGAAVPRRAFEGVRTAEANARRSLGEAQFAERFAAGQSLPIDAALAEAEAVADAIASSADGDRIALGDLELAPQAAHRAHDLTPREIEVLQLMAQRLTDAEIADQLYISYRTVTTHVARICEKLEAANRRDAGAKAARLGLIHQPTQPGISVVAKPAGGQPSA